MNIRSRQISNSRFLKSPFFDGFFFLGSPLLLIPLAFVLGSIPNPDPITNLIMALGGVGHHLPGMIRAYGNPDIFRQFKTRFIISPIFLLIVSVSYSLMDLSVLTFLLILWSYWHGAMQTFGFMRLYEVKSGIKSRPLSRNIDLIACLSLFLIGIWANNERQSTLFTNFLQSGGFDISPLFLIPFQHIFITLAIIFTALFLYAQIKELGFWNGILSPKSISLFSATLLWNFSLRYFNNPIIGIAVFEIFHDTQYLALIWMINRVRVGKNVSSNFENFLFSSKKIKIPLYISICLLYGTIKLLPTQLGNEKFVSKLFEGFYIASSFLHFYFDSFIWNIKDLKARSEIKFKPSEMTEASSSKPFFPNMAWLLFLVPLILFGYRQHFHKAISTRDIIIIVFKAFPQSWGATTTYALMMRNEGHWENAEDGFSKSLKIRQDISEIHAIRGEVLLSLGDTSSALKSMTTAYKISPDWKIALNLGILSANLGDTQQAINYLNQGIKLNPQAEILKQRLYRLTR